MKPRPLGMFALITFAFVLGSAFGHQAVIWGAKANLALVAACCISTLLQGPAASSIGFLCGAYEGGFAGAALGTLMVSRTLTCWALGGLGNLFLREGAFVAPIATFVGTLTADLLAYLFNPAGGIGVKALLGGAIYNAVLAPPIYWVVRRVGMRRITD